MSKWLLKYSQFFLNVPEHSLPSVMREHDPETVLPSGITSASCGNKCSIPEQKTEHTKGTGNFEYSSFDSQRICSTRAIVFNAKFCVEIYCAVLDPLYCTALYYTNCNMRMNTSLQFVGVRKTMLSNYQQAR
jgi:hypothetical protein